MKGGGGEGGGADGAAAGDGGRGSLASLEKINENKRSKCSPAESIFLISGHDPAGFKSSVVPLPSILHRRPAAWQPSPPSPPPLPPAPDSVPT